MSIPLKLFIDGLSNGSLFSETSNLDLIFSESKNMADIVEIQFVDESEYQSEGKWYIHIDNSRGPLLSLKFPHHCQPQFEVARCADV